MGDFTLDTSGFVVVETVAPYGNISVTSAKSWAELPNDFVRGYIEALFNEGWDWPSWREPGPSNFGWLAPETLAAILKDCAKFKADGYGWADDDATDGALLWGTRQSGEWADVGFPPLKVTLNDDGKIYLQEANHD